MTIKGKVVGVEENSFKGSDGKEVKYTRLLLRSSETGKVVKYKADPTYDFKPYLDKDVEVLLEIGADKEMMPTIKAKEVVKK